MTLDCTRVAVDPSASYNLAGVFSFGRGLFEREPLMGAATAYKYLHRLRAGQFVMSKLKAWEGAVSVVADEFDGHVLSPEFPTFSLQSGLLPDFLALTCAQPSFWQQMQEESAGMGGRRERVHPNRLLSIAIDVPPVPVQRRIVDLVAAVDAAIKESQNEHKAALDTAHILRENGLSGVRKIALSELLVSIEAGKSPAAEDRVPGPGDLAVLKVSAVRRGWFDESQVKVISNADGFPSHAALRDGDLLMTRANTRELVGLVCRVERARRGWFLCDKTLRLNPHLDLVSHDYLLETLLSDIVRRQIEEAATGTSGSMKNISQASIGNLQIPLMPRDRQDDWTGTLAEARSVAQLSTQLNAELRALRGALVPELISGDHQIPRSYDALMVPR